MEYEWDENKRLANIKKHGVDFWSVYDFEWEDAAIEEDTKRDYGERRLLATGMIKGRLHRLVHTERNSKVRVIALRRTNKREEKKYGKQK